jgi:putative membrane protein
MNSRLIDKATADWQRLSVFSVIHFFSVNTINTVRTSIYAAPAIALNLSAVKENAHLVTLGIAIVLTILFVFSVLTYLRFRFRLSDSELQVRAGVLHKKHLDLPFNRVQSVKVVQPIIFRVFGFAVLQFDSAGSAKEEATLAALPLEQAQALKAFVLDAQQQKDAPSTESQDKSPDILCTRTLYDLIIHGLTSNRVWILLGATTPFLEKGFTTLAKTLESNGMEISQAVNNYAQIWWHLGLLIIGGVVLLFLTVAALSIIGAIVLFYGYTLVKDNDRYIRKSGLFTVQEVSVKHARLQIIRMSQSWLDRLFGRFNFYYFANSSGVIGQDTARGADRIAVPSITYPQGMDLLNDAMAGNKLGSIQFAAISKAFIISRVLLISLPMSCFGFILLLGDSVIGPWLLIALAWTVVPLLIGLRWYRWGYAQDDKYMYIRKGLLGSALHVFEKHKVQQVGLKQTWFMARRKLTHLKIVLASGAVSVPFVSEKTGTALSNELLKNAINTQKSWM